MSYLDLPRLYFSGQFLANPSTVNNTPNNYNANHTLPTDATIADNLFTPIASSPPNSYNNNNVDLFWNPNGSATFGFVDCTVQKVSYPDGTDATSPNVDPIVGQPLVSNPGSQSALQQAKIVDLDPMQQNVSEVWGMNVGIGDAIGGDFMKVAFIGIWLQAKTIPPGDTAGSAFYQSVLTHLTEGKGMSHLAVESRFVRTIADEAVLSMSFVLRAHNSNPQIYLLDEKTMAEMEKQGVPKSELEKLKPLTFYASHPTSPAGAIPTESYFQKLLARQKVDSKYVGTITTVAKQPYTPATPYPFTHGQVAGSIGIQRSDEPAHVAAGSRMLTPSPGTQGKFGVYDPLCNDAPFKVIEQESKPAVAVNLGNSLPSTTAGSVPYQQKLGTLKLCYFDVEKGGEISAANAKPLPGDIDYDPGTFFTESSGIVDLPVEEGIIGKPMGLVQVDDSGAVTEVFLQEDVDGYYLRADRFVFRMEPGAPSAEQAVEIYVTQFGQPKKDEVVEVHLMTPDEAVAYTNATPGTGGSPGVNNLSIPQTAITIENPEATTDENGKATITVKASDPGNPRDYIDGQIYFLTYKLKSADKGYSQSPDDIITIQVYQQHPLSLLIPENNPTSKLITWNNGVRDILAQYDKLYPVMSFLDLGNYEVVTEPKNLQKIKTVFETTLENPIHMPVTRDLSESRRAVILSWIENGAPRDC